MPLVSGGAARLPMELEGIRKKRPKVGVLWGCEPDDLSSVFFRRISIAFPTFRSVLGLLCKICKMLMTFKWSIDPGSTKSALTKQAAGFPSGEAWLPEVSYSTGLFLGEGLAGGFLYQTTKSSKPWMTGWLAGNLVGILQLGVSENSVPLNPMVNDHYPY